MCRSGAESSSTPSGLEFITSAGLRVLLQAQRTVWAAGASLVVCGVGRVAGDVFRISCFETLLMVAPSAGHPVGRLSPAANEARAG